MEKDSNDTMTLLNNANKIESSKTTKERSINKLMKSV